MTALIVISIVIPYAALGVGVLYLMGEEAYGKEADIDLAVLSVAIIMFWPVFALIVAVWLVWQGLVKIPKRAGRKKQTK